MPAGIIKAAGTAVSAGLVAGAASKAQQGYSAANQADLGLENQILNTTGQNLQPQVTEGQSAGGALGGLLGLPGYNAAQSQAAFKNYLGSTNYDFLLNQGEQAQGYLNAPALQSGGTAKALQSFGQGLAGNALQGYEGLLQNQQGLGVQAGSALGQIGSSIAGLNQQAQEYGANMQGAGDLYSANALSSGITGLTGQIANSGALGPIQNALSSIFGGGTSSSSYGALGSGALSGLGNTGVTSNVTLPLGG